MIPAERVVAEGGRAVVFKTGLIGQAPVSVGREIASGSRRDNGGRGTSEAGIETFMYGKKWGSVTSTRRGASP